MDDFPGWRTLSSWLDSQFLWPQPHLTPLQQCWQRGFAVPIPGSLQDTLHQAWLSEGLQPAGPPLEAGWPGMQAAPSKTTAGACGACGVGDPAWREAAWCLSQSQAALSLCL